MRRLVSCSGSKKGQTLVFERLLLFMISVVVFIVCFAIFVSYQEYFVGVSITDQIRAVGNHVSSKILKVAAQDYSEEAVIKVDIPQRIGDETYMIKLSNVGLNITTGESGVSSLFKLYDINSSFDLGGSTIMSSISEFMIYKKGNRIILL